MTYASREIPGRAGLESLAAAMQAFLVDLPGAESFLCGWPSPQAERSVAPFALPVLAWLADTRTATVPSTAGLVEMLVSCSHLLAWGQTYTEAEVGSTFLDRYGWTEVIGTRGPIPSETLAAGFLMIGPETTYPSHAHQAEELYVPLAGTAAWTRGDEGFATRVAGEAIRHVSCIPHAMRTGAEPLLALYVWRGDDLAAKSRIITPV